MSASKLILSFFLLSCFFIYFASSSSSLNTTKKCSVEQTLALILFKQNLSSITFSIDDPPYYSPCQDWLGYDYHPLMMNWNTSTDCCNWNGITCDHFTGDVIGIDLSCGMLRGTVHPNTTLFHLPHLQRLNLAYNDFTSSQLPREIRMFSNSLTHLNLSYCRFTGEISSEISMLSKLVSIDLSSGYELSFQIQPHVFINLLQNSTDLKELSFTGVDISSVLPTYLNISSSLKLLSLGYTGLKGKLPHNIFSLQSLEKLDLSENYFTGQISSEISLPKLVYLDLSLNNNLQIQHSFLDNLFQNSTFLSDISLTFVNVGGWVLPNHLNTTYLMSLDLHSTGLQGTLPDNIFGLQFLEALSLGGNYFLNGPLPKVNRSTNTPLKKIDLAFISLSGGSEVLDSIGHIKSLTYLDLSDCGLVGPLPKSLANLRDLTYLSLSSNMLNGTLPSWLFTHVPSLEYVLLSHNMFTGKLPLELFAVQSLQSLSLGNNQFDGQIDVLDQGPTLQTFRNLINLEILDLSFNNFRGDWELDTLLSSLINISSLYLSYSGLSIMNNNTITVHVNTDVRGLDLAACNLTVFPGSIRAMKKLRSLDLSSNYIGGYIPHWAGELGELLLLNLSHNSITSFPQLQWKNMKSLHLKSNLMQGQFPPAICNMSIHARLDISDNNFFGMIPQCFGNISSNLRMVDMGNNHFHGTIPDVYEDCGELEGLVLNGNQLEGEVPSYLSKCLSLKVLDLGNNRLNGTFPNWLEDLPHLQVLVLKSNNMSGPIVNSSQVKLPFPDLQVLDLSNNGFVGHLPRIYFQSFNAMRDRVSIDPEPQYLYAGGLYYSISVVVKGQQLPFPQIFVDYTIINLSNNKFEGEIPDVIGGLTSLVVLDLSHNNLIGRIPDALGKILEIQSLDLSWNKLTGEIPLSLVDLKFLAFLNLSQNHLVGRIPAGRQFNTFENNSYGGNPELCGLPLSKKCELPHEPEPQLVDDEDTESGFTWRVVMLGYGCGTLLGLVMGYIMLSTGKPKWFNAIADAGERMIQAKQKRRRIVYIGR